MNELQLFRHEEFGQLRVITKDNEFWFIGADITEKLGYQNGSRDINRHTDEDDRKEVVIFDGIQNRKMIAINESGLYSLVLGSKLLAAKKFKRWVTSEVLPQIRKTGGYIPTNEEDDAETIMAKALIVAQKTIEKKNELIKAKDKELNEVKKDLNTKSKFINQIAVSQNSLKVEEIAQIASKEGIKIGRNKLWKKLREWGMIKKNTKYDPKQDYIDRGYFEVVEGTKENYKGVFTYKTTRVLGKGQVYIINKLLEESEDI